MLLNLNSLNQFDFTLYALPNIENPPITSAMSAIQKAILIKKTNARTTNPTPNTQKMVLPTRRASSNRIRNPIINPTVETSSNMIEKSLALYFKNTSY